MDTSALATSFGARLPDWVLSELAGVPEVLPTDEDRIRLANRLAERNHREDTGGPFAALVVDSATGRLVSAGVNLVLSSGLSSTHAEVVALSLAQTRLSTWNLGAPGAPELELVVNWRPCVMCYGAAMWSGVRRLLIAGDGPEVEALTGFDEGPMREDWAEQFGERGIRVDRGVLRDEAIEVFREYGAREDAVVYNAR
ncbi:nucleoside deaminase [Streptomyces sp. NPDC093109]|uniref:nucleoside deaminase n=1 Tax=Streptomyces sp. NPDC093109 TaxID=3154977 RepID=UPI00344C6D70